MFATVKHWVVVSFEINHPFCNLGRKVKPSAILFDGDENLFIFGDRILEKGSDIFTGEFKSLHTSLKASFAMRAAYYTLARVQPI